MFKKNTFIETLCVCWFIHACKTTIDWAVVSEDICLSNSSTRHCVSQHDSSGRCAAPSNSLHPFLSECLMDSSLPPLTTNTHLHTYSDSPFLSVLVLVFPSQTQKYTQMAAHMYTHTHRLIHYELNICCERYRRLASSFRGWFSVFSLYCLRGKRKVADSSPNQFIYNENSIAHVILKMSCYVLDGDN